MDVIDKAQRQEQWHREQALARARSTHSGPSARRCDSCGIAIPQARREALPGVRLCVSCQQEREMRRGY